MLVQRPREHSKNASHGITQNISTVTPLQPQRMSCGVIGHRWRSTVSSGLIRTQSSILLLLCQGQCLWSMVACYFFGMILMMQQHHEGCVKFLRHSGHVIQTREFCLIVFLILEDNFLDFPPKQPQKRLGLIGEDSSMMGVDFWTGTSLLSSKAINTSGSGTSTIPTLKKYSSGGLQLISNFLTVNILSR